TAVTRANGTTLAAMGTRNTVQTTALAVNAAGRIAYVGTLNGLESIDFNAPDAPPNLTARAGIGSVLLTWSPPADPGISPITSYDVICSNCPGVTVPATQTSVVLTGLAATNHVFTVDAVNASGAGPSSIAMGATPEAGGTFHALNPTRILDTRNGTGTGTVAPIGPGATLHLQVAQRGGVPAANVSAVVLNVTVTDTTAASFLTVFPTGTALPTASSLNWVAGETVPNLVEVALGAGGQVSLFNHSGSTDVVVDVEGWVGDATNSSGLSGMFNGLQPARLLDTRTGPGGIVGPLGPGATLNLQVTGAGGVPATGVSAVVLNVTVTDTSDASFLTVFPAGTARPTASNLNWVPGETVPNRVIVEVGAGGQVSVFNHSGSTDVVVDVNGWFTDASSSAGGSGFAAVVPTRILDSRIPGGSGPLQGGATFTLTPTGPSDLTGVVINLTATDATSATFLTAWPAGQPQPRTSDLNPAAGQTVPNMVVVGLGKGSFEVFNQQGSVDVIADLMGQYGAVVQATSPA
ncbi:MAG TPA: fibronectin type III domain-containing protein, partial [Candidatus Dormibacteraeota bacterium]|nr:fibronectin type III domain-containing protein [Candidatus Dormibacteraeota bacterium]